jgi:hypothetical protein
MVPFLARWFEAAPLCCGGCPTCATGAITGLTLEVIGTRPKPEARADSVGDWAASPLA